MTHDSSTGELGERDQAALLARIERMYQVVLRRLHVGQLEFAYFTLANPDDVLEKMERTAKPEQSTAPEYQPYWIHAWESGQALAEFLDRYSAIFPLAGQRVLDLGCGLGLVGSVAAARGADVTMADAASAALLFARLNSWPWRERVVCRRINWNRDRIGGRRFDVILGSDVLYDPTDWPALERFCHLHLAEQGNLLLAEPGRRRCREFPAWLADRGWTVDVFPIKCGENPNEFRVIAAVPTGV